MSISRAWDETREVFARDGKLVATVAAALVVIPGMVRDMFTPPIEAGQIPEAGAWMLVWFASALVIIIGQLAVVRLAIGNRVTVGEAIGHGARRMPVYFLGQLIWAMPFAVAFVALLPLIRPPEPSAPAALAFLISFILLVFVIVRMLLTAPVVSEEGVGPIGMIKRSWFLTHGQWWRLFGFVLLWLIGTGILVLAVASVLGLVAEAILGGQGPFSLGALIVSLAVQVVGAGAYVLLFVMLGRLYVQAAGRGEAKASVPTTGN